MTSLAPADPSTARRTAVPGVLRLGLVRALYEVRVFFRERDAVVFIFAYPVIMMAIFATVFGQDGATVRAGDVEIPFAQYFLPGMLATGVMLSSFQSLAISIDRESGGQVPCETTRSDVDWAYLRGSTSTPLTVASRGHSRTRRRA